VSQQHVLDLRGSDILRAPDDRVVGAPADEQVSVGVEVAVILGVEEAPVIDRAAQARVLSGHLLAAHADPARLAGAEDFTAGPADFELDPGQRLADRGQPGPHRRVRRLQGGAVVLRPEEGDGRTGLGEPVGVDEIYLRPFPQRPLDERGRHRSAAVGQRPQRRHGLVFRAVHDPGEHRRDHHRAGHLLLPHRAQPLTRGEVLENQGPAPGVQIGDHVRDGGDVIRRNADQSRFRLAGRCELDRPQHVGDQVLVPEQHALGLRRGAAGVDDDRDRVLPGPVPAGRGIAGRGIAGRGVAGPRVADLSAIDVRLGQPGVGGHRVESGPLEVREQIGVRDPQRLRVLGQQGVQLTLAEPVVEGNQRHPRARGGEQRDREGGTVHRQVDDGLRPALAHQRGPGVRPRRQLGGGDPAGLAAGQDTVTESVHGHVEQQRQVHGSILAQSEAGSGLAAWITSGLPSSASVPPPALVHST